MGTPLLRDFRLFFLVADTAIAIIFMVEVVARLYAADSKASFPFEPVNIG